MNMTSVFNKNMLSKVYTVEVVNKTEKLEGPFVKK